MGNAHPSRHRRFCGRAAALAAAGRLPPVGFVFEALAGADPSTTAFLTIHNMVTWMLGTWGGEAVRARWGEALTGGDKLKRTPPANFPCRLINNYGPTENTVVATSGLATTVSAGAAPSIAAKASRTETTRACCLEGMGNS